MNILFICNSYPTKSNPFNQIFIKKLVDELNKDPNINIDICYNKIFDFWGNANKVKNPLANLVKYIFFWSGILFYAFKGIKKYDVLFPQGILFSTLAAVLLKKLFRVPVVSYIHGGDLNLHYNKSGLLSEIVRYSLNNSDVIIANSLDIYEKVGYISSNTNVSLISPGVDIQVMRKLPNVDILKQSYGIPENKVILLLAGNSIYRKGFDVFLKSLLLLDSKILDEIYILMLTDGPLKSDYEEFISLNNLGSSIEIRNKVPPIILNEYYNISNIFVFPSREEPLGLVGLEAMSAGNLVIGSNVGGIKEFVVHGETGFLFESENSHELAELLSYAVMEFNNLGYILKNSGKVVDHHSLSDSAKKLSRIFMQL